MKKFLGIILLIVGIYLLLSAFPATRPLNDSLLSLIGLGNDHSANRAVINQDKDVLDIVNSSGGLLSVVISLFVLFRRDGK